jgi:hypothetical protein|tara:strand:+ start:531 stop:731 length:201 start_codon:yes stop_codon:yes gene_type:complete
MTPSTLNELDGTIKSKSLVELLSKKVELKKELIILKKLHKDVKKQEELVESITQIEKFLSIHRIQK